MDGGIWREKGSELLDVERGIDGGDGVGSFLLQEPYQRETVKHGLGWFCRGFWTMDDMSLLINSLTVKVK